MASGGLPPTKQMPPPRGWTPGASIDPAQNNHDEIIANNQWHRLMESCQNTNSIQFNDKCGQFISYWNFLGTDPVAKRLVDTPQQKKRFCQLLREHQLLTVHPKWVEEVNSEVRTKLCTAMCSAEHLAKRYHKPAAFSFLKRCHKNAWDASILREIFSNKLSSTTVDYFQLECYDVCMRRLEVLMDSNLDICAYNFTTFLIKRVFDPQNEFLEKEWLYGKRDNAYNILDLHLAILYKRKEDSSKLQYMLKTLPIDAIIGTAEKFSNRNISQNKHFHDWISKFWTPQNNLKAMKALLDHAMCTASRKRLDEKITKRIVTAWFNCLNFEASDSNLDLEVEKFVALDEHSTLSYIIGHRLAQKYGRERRELCLEQMVRGLCCDINKLEVARSTNDDSMVKRTEQNLSYGLQTLAEIMKDDTTDHLVFERECILTAFSLNPTPDLYEKIVALAQRSGFIQSESMDLDSKDEIYKEFWNPDPNEFDQDSQALMESLGKGFGKAPNKLRANTILCEKKHRNLEALISIQGDLVTEASNYDPVKAPLKSLTAKALGLSNTKLMDDLLIIIDGPRWHLLTWVLDWPKLEEQCQALLRDPNIRRPTKELKYLVIDYTQFDEWSSEEEVTFNTGIEKGYENWVHVESDEDEPIVEKGLDKVDEADYAIPILDPEQLSDDDNKNDVQSSFLVKKEEADTKDRLLQQNNEDVRATLPRVVPGLNDKSFFGPKRPVEYEVRVVQISHTSTVTSHNNTTPSSYTMANSFPTNNNDNISNRGGPQIEAVASLHHNNEDVRAILRRVVPGLNDDQSYFGPKRPIEHEVRVVQVSHASTASSATPTTTTAITSTTNNNSSRGGPQIEAATSAASSSNSSATVVTNTATTTSKVQYVYKQGGQTVLIDYPMNEETFSKLKATTSTQPQRVMISSTPKVLLSSNVDTLANSLISQITAPVNVPTAAGSTTNTTVVATNGQLETNNKVNGGHAGGSLPKFQFAFGRGGNTNSPTTVVNTDNSATGTGNTTKSSSEIQINGNRQIQIAAPTGATTQRCIVQMGGSPTKVQYNAIMKPTNIVQRPLSVVVPVVTVEGGGAQAVIANARTVLANQQQQKQQHQHQTNDNSTHQDLITQLNMARAQGLVVLQQWGDKQVLVHKATGRWIMRQGNRLVTVPPQALGITSTTSAATPAATTSVMTLSTNTVGQTSIKQEPQQTVAVRSMSSSTMEQLAEFDSILESKFKSSPSPTPEPAPSPSPSSSSSGITTSTTAASSSTSVITSSTGAGSSLVNKTKNSGPTFVIITPSTSNTSGTVTTSFNTSVIKKEIVPIGSSAVGTTKLNGTTAMKLVTSSQSAPNSPVKGVKMACSSISANTSPTGSGNIISAAQAAASSAAAAAGAVAASGFVKPPPKPQEDPDTLKRIQQILDDYNEQIRNSPDLQNRPAPRRRTNGPTTPTSVSGGGTTTTTPPPPPMPSAISRKRPSLSSGSPNSSCGSESPLMVCSSQNDLDTGSSSVVQVSSFSDAEESSSSSSGNSNTNSNNSGLKQNNSKPVLRQIMVPPALAASLQATGRQLMVITGPGGKKMIALRPLTSTVTTNTTATASTKPTRVIPNSTATRIPQQNTNNSNTNLNSSNNLIITTTTNSNSTASSSIVSSSPIMASNAHPPPTCSPSPPSLASSSDERPVTPGLGIPMEMTPGQIMEAEISASFLDDDDVQHPQHTASSLSIRGPRSETDDLESETLPEDLFTHDQPPSPATTSLTRPPVITEETEVDTDDVTEDEASAGVSPGIFSNNSHSTKRKRSSTLELQPDYLLNSSNDESATIGNNKRTRQPSSNSVSGVKTRQRNLSSHMIKKSSGITESSRTSSHNKK